MWRSGWFEQDLVGDTSAHECATRLWLTSAASAAIRDRRMAVFSVLTVAGTCLSGVPALLLAIPLTYALRFVIALLDGRARQAALQDARKRPIDLPLSMSFSEEEARRLVERLERVRWAIESAVRAGPSGSAFAVTGLIEEVPQLERDIVILATRIEYVGQFVSSAPWTGLQIDVARFDQDREKETDGAAREGLQRVIGRCQGHLDTMRTLQTRRCRALLTAEELLRTLEQIPARIVSLQVARVDACDPHAADSTHRAAAAMEGFADLGLLVGHHRRYPLERRRASYSVATPP